MILPRANDRLSLGRRGTRSSSPLKPGTLRPLEFDGWVQDIMIAHLFGAAVVLPQVVFSRQRCSFKPACYLQYTGEVSFGDAYDTSRALAAGHQLFLSGHQLFLVDCFVDCLELARVLKPICAVFPTLWVGRAPCAVVRCAS